MSEAGHRLAGRPFVGFVRITDRARARAFYCDILGLPVAHEDEFALVLDVGGATLRLITVEAVPEPDATNAGWVVDDVGAAARALVEGGVTFERFDGMDQDEDGVWYTAGGAVAWFRDPDGNRLSLSHST